MVKSKSFQKSFAIVMMFIMMFSFAFVSSPSASAASAKKVTVKKVAVTNLTSKVLYVAKGKTVAIKTNVTVTPNKAANKKVSYKTKSKKIAKVTKKGVVKGVKVGTTKITVTSKSNKKKKTTFKVKVTAPAKSVALNSTKQTLTVGTTSALKATVAPAKNTCKVVTFVSSNKNVATVDKNGKVVAKSAGVATITAKTIDGTNKKATCTVTVVNPVSIVSANIENAGNMASSYKIKVVLNQPKVLTKSDFTVKEKMLANGVYKKSIKLDSIYTTDNKTYLVELSDSMSVGCYYLLTINSLDGQKNAELFFKINGESVNTVISGEVGMNLSETIGSNGENGNYTTSIVAGQLPAGLKFDNDRNKVYGTPTAIVNNQLVVFKTVDELGTEFTINANFVIADDKNLVAINQVYGDVDRIYKNSGESNVSASVIGGSGEYEYSLVNDFNGAFSLEDENGYGDAQINFNTSDLKAGEYNIQVKFTDADDSALTATANIKIIITDTYKMTVTLKNSSNAELGFFNNSIGEYFWNYTSNNYNEETDVIVLEYYIPAGNYEIYAYDSFENITVFADNITINGDRAFTYSMPPANKVNVTVTDSNNVQLKDNYYVIFEQKQVDSTGINSAFGSFNSKENAFSFKNIPNGDYRVKVYEIDYDELDSTLIYTSDYFNVKGNSNLQFKINDYTVE